MISDVPAQEELPNPSPSLSAIPYWNEEGSGHSEFRSSRGKYMISRINDEESAASTTTGRNWRVRRWNDLFGGVERKVPISVLIFNFGLYSI